MFSANLGFLFSDLPMPERVRSAARAGFDAVECHFPYDTPAATLCATSEETGMKMLGLCAVSGREEEARAAIRQAVTCAARIDAANVHVMAGRTDGGRQADDFYRANLSYACDLAAAQGMTILIEPINHRDVPGYHLAFMEKGKALIEDLGRDNLKLMFDCYRTQIMQGDLTERLRRCMPVIGHIQIAAVPDRSEPDGGEVHYLNLIASIREMGFTATIGAEYKPRNGNTEQGLDWLWKFKEDLR